MRKIFVGIATVCSAFGCVASGGAFAAETICVSSAAELADAVRRIGEIRKTSRDVPIDVVLSGGDYDMPAGIRLKEGLSFRSSSSAKVVFRAADGASPRICGGTVVKGWRRVPFNGRSDVWAADVSSLGLKSRLSLFYCGGVSMTLCRQPNFDPRHPYSGGWAYVPGKPISMYKEIKGERDDQMPVKPEDWRDRACIEEGRVNIFPRYNWWNRVMPIASCDPTNRILRFAEPVSKRQPGRFAPRAQDRYCFMGYREDLDRPGEWYHDLEGGKVYFIPPDGADPNTKRTAVLVGTKPVFLLESVTNVVIKGLEICEAAAAVTATRADRCEVVACRIHDMGFATGSAVMLHGTRCTARDCDVWNIGADGITIGGGWNRKYAPDTRDGNLVENNYIHHTGLVNRHGFGVYVAGQGSRVSRNLIHDMPRGGIFYAGRFLTIDRNRIRHVNLEMEDTAAIYGGGYVNNTGTKINGNWVSHSIGFSHDKEGAYSFRKTCAWGIYLDDCSGGAEVVGNLVEHCNGGAMHMHCARFNVISNNVFVSNGGESGTPRQFSIRGWKLTDTSRIKGYLATSAQHAYESLLAVSPAWTNFVALAHEPKNPDAPDGYVMQGNRIVNNIWYYPDQPESAVYAPGNYNVSNNVFDANVIWGGSGEVKIRLDQQQIALDEWRAKGQERTSVIADPLFKDPANGDWSFREGSPALALGIVPVHPKETGLYLNGNRKSFPVEAEGVREHPEWLTIPPER